MGVVENITDCIFVAIHCCVLQVAEAMLARRRRLRRFETRSAAVKKRADPVVRFQAFATQAGIHTTTTTAAATTSDSSAYGSSSDHSSITPAPPATVQQHQQQRRLYATASTSGTAVYQLASTGGSETESANGYMNGYTVQTLQGPLQRAWGTPDTADTASQFDVHTTTVQAAASTVKSSSTGRGRARGAMLHAQTFDLDMSAAVLERERTAQRHK
jgi:hypothetical protein